MLVGLVPLEQCPQTRFLREHMGSQRHAGSLARGFVHEPVLLNPTEQNYTTQQHSSQKRFVQDHPGVLTPKMEKNAEWRVFFFLSFFGCTSQHTGS